MSVELKKVEFVHGLNAHRDLFVQNIRENMGLAYLPRFATKKALMVAGGPSANDHIDDIAKKAKQGWEVWCVNGAHDWLRANCATRPHTCVLMDASPVVDTFIRQPLGGVRYLLASQCNPKLVNRLNKAGHNVVLWHAALDKEAHELMGEDATITSGVNTVGLHTLQLMLLSGIRKVRVYGMDSSHRPDADHAYDNSHQAHADELDFFFQGQIYKATGTWAAQAQLFHTLYPKFFHGGLRIEVIGDGLLPAMWRDAHRALIEDLMSK